MEIKNDKILEECINDKHPLFLANELSVELKGDE
jgi:hypothetical protein